MIRVCAAQRRAAPSQSRGVLIPTSSSLNSPPTGGRSRLDLLEKAADATGRLDARASAQETSICINRIFSRFQFLFS